MASQNRDPAAASVAAARKGAEPSGGAARGPVGKRLQQELMTLMVSGSISTSITLGLLSSPRQTQRSLRALYRGLGWDMRLRVGGSLPPSVSPMPEPNIDSPLNTHAAELWKNPTAFKKYLQETYSKQVSSQDP
ncbi:ubiquitin-conjugating enzyme E2 C isoform X4 [Neomonachus schauinslandi]|uniref:Ubiquitin-conjugating enzyme E2 C isoform X4 n=1 Tax=Neomonachus schauinslandi TaxID=29088 RepID=A0A8M1MLN2_NEOSC|nr:ubiquitin-conjugating enzyme E2 C isoform X4 [Neomonachus schauinslandi]